MSSGIPVFSRRIVSPETSGKREELVKEFWQFEEGLFAALLQAKKVEVSDSLTVVTLTVTGITTLGSTFVLDSLFQIRNSLDQSKIAIFSLGDASTNSILTLRWIGTADRTITIPDATGTLALTSSRSMEWRANGSYIVDTTVDGGVIAHTAMTISDVWLYRLTAGSSGSTTVDLNKNGTTMYTTQANRPSLAFNAGNNVHATLPDVTSVAAGDVLSMDIDAVDGGSPGNLVLVVKAT